MSAKVDSSRPFSLPGKVPLRLKTSQFPSLTKHFGFYLHIILCICFLFSILNDTAVMSSYLSCCNILLTGLPGSALPTPMPSIRLICHHQINVTVAISEIWEASAVWLVLSYPEISLQHLILGSPYPFIACVF